MIKHFLIFLLSLLTVSAGIADPRQPVTTSQNTAALIAEYDQKISDLEYQLRDLTGKMQLMEHRLRQMQDYLSLYVEKTAGRLQDLEKLQLIPPTNHNVEASAKSEVEQKVARAKQKSAQAESTQPKLKKIDSSKASIDKTSEQNIDVFELKPKNPSQVKQRYNYARSFLLSKDYDLAELALKKFVNAHKEHDLSGNAMYWLGETYYVRNNYIKATQAFSQAYQDYPKSKKAPDILLKLAMSLTALNKKPEACQTYNKLIELYPNARKSILMHAKKALKRNGCQRQ